MSVCQIDFLLHYDNNQTVYKGWTWLLALKSEAIVKVELDWTEKAAGEFGSLKAKDKNKMIAQDFCTLLYCIFFLIVSMGTKEG